MRSFIFPWFLLVDKPGDVDVNSQKKNEDIYRTMSYYEHVKDVILIRITLLHWKTLDI